MHLRQATLACLSFLCATLYRRRDSRPTCRAQSPVSHHTKRSTAGTSSTPWNEEANAQAALHAHVVAAKTPSLLGWNAGDENLAFARSKLPHKISQLTHRPPRESPSVLRARLIQVKFKRWAHHLAVAKIEGKELKVMGEVGNVDSEV